MGKEMLGAFFFFLENLALQLGLGSNASLKDIGINYVAANFLLTKAMQKQQNRYS